MIIADVARSAEDISRDCSAVLIASRLFARLDEPRAMCVFAKDRPMTPRVDVAQYHARDVLRAGRDGWRMSDDAAHAIRETWDACRHISPDGVSRLPVEYTGFGYRQM